MPVRGVELVERRRRVALLGLRPAAAGVASRCGHYVRQLIRLTPGAQKATRAAPACAMCGVTAGHEPCAPEMLASHGPCNHRSSTEQGRSSHGIYL
jgi:hypothetical protein